MCLLRCLDSRPLLALETSTSGSTKLTSVDYPYTYLLTAEYKIFEIGLAIERGHRDGVGIDEWVAYEYGKVKRYCDENGWSDRTGIAWFNGPPRIDGAVAIPFLRKWLGR